MLLFVQAAVDDLLATESHQVPEHRIQNFHAAMQVLLYMADKLSTTKCRQSQVQLNGAHTGKTTWLDAHYRMAIAQLMLKIHQVTPVECSHCNQLVQHHERQWLQEVGTKTSGPRSIFAKNLALLKSAAKGKAYRAANMTTNKPLQYPKHLSDREPEAITWSFADTERVTYQLERHI